MRLLVTVFALLVCSTAGAAEWWQAAPFSVPARELQQAAGALKRERASDVVVMLDERSYSFDEQHRVTVTARMIYRVDTPAGVENWAASSAGWQPWYQARPVVRARVITADGREHALDQDMLRDAATRSGDNQVYDDSHVLEGPLPAIAVGAVVEEEITLRDEKPFFAAGSVYREYIGRPVPVLRTRIVIDAPESLPLKRLTRMLPDAQMRETRANGRVRWVLEQGLIEAREAMDSNLPPEAAGWSSVEFSTAPTWEAVVAHYRELTEPRIRKDDARPLIAGLPAGRSTWARREHIARLVERLHREVRYTGVEFGEARLIPAFPADTLQRKFGDCKDKSTLLVAALRASGIDAYLALLSAGSGQDVSPELPGLGMFDHAIVYVPGTGGEDALWIDATSEYARVGTLPASDSDRLALVIRAGEKTLVRTPALKSADNVQIETREFRLAEYGPAQVVETTETRGTVELEYRTWYAGADTQERLDSLREYAENAYRAKALSNYSHTASTDFSRYYSMRLDIREAPVGSTDLNAAAVGVHVGNIITRLPSYFSEQLGDDAELDTGRRDDVVFEPYIVEWRYRVHPPEGFRPRALPENGRLALGPALLTAEFTRAKDGAVHANWRFDTVKGRYTPAESLAFVKAVRELKQRPTLLIAFDHEGAARRGEGDFKGALGAYRQLVDKHPKQAVHRVRHAYALLEAGLGTRAQQEALAATKLEPKYAFAWKALGWVRQHDAVGRRFGAGFDRDGALQAYTQARTLEPENSDISADFGVLLEHDASGARYADKAGLELAVKEYRERARRKGDGQRQDRYLDNLFYALLYLGRFEEARDAIRQEPSNATRRALLLTAIAGAQGSAKAVEHARELLNGDADRRAALKSASGILTNLREYTKASDLLDASTRGQTVSIADSQRIALLRKSQSAARQQVRVTDAASVVLKAISLLLDRDVQTAEFQKLLSRNALQGDAAGDLFLDSRRGLYAVLTRSDMPFDVAADLLYANLRVTVEGDDSQGYRAQARNAGLTTRYYVVREDGQYRLLTGGAQTAPLARQALQHLDAGDLEGARRWLNWARQEQRAESSDDPLYGYTFSRFWIVGAPSDGDDIRTAVALLFADSGLSEAALPLLQAAQSAARTDAARLSIELALAMVHQRLSQWPQLDIVATRLVAAWPQSAQAFHYQQWARIQMKRWDEVAAAARARLARLPDDDTARRVLIETADARGDAAGMLTLLQPVVEGPRATPADFNEYAWASLMQRDTPARALELARQAYDETEGREAAIAHTLACVYATTGRPREARELLLARLTRASNADTPDDAAWFGFGLVAEAYGDQESARDYYSRVSKPETAAAATSVYSMAQNRLKAIR